MPNTASAKKRLRQTEVRRAANRRDRSALRGQIRKVRTAVQAGNLESAQAEFQTAVKKLDQMGAKLVIHPNAAARLKSRLSAAVKKLKLAKAAS